MSFAAAKIAIETYINSNYSSTPISWDNVDFSLPSTEGEFIRVTLLPAEKPREIFGSTTPYNDTYLLNIGIFSRSGSGAGDAYEIADTLSALLTEKTISGYTTEVAQVQQIGDDGNFFHLALTVFFNKFV